MQIIDFSELFLPDDLIVIECALFLVGAQMQIEEWLDLLQEDRQGVHVEFWRRLVHTLIITVILVFIRRVRTGVHCLSLSVHHFDSSRCGYFF